MISPSDSRVCLDSTDWPGSPHVATRLPVDRHDVLTSQFDDANWYMPVVVTLHARNDFAVEDPHNTRCCTRSTRRHATTDAGYLAAAAQIRAARRRARRSTTRRRACSRSRATARRSSSPAATRPARRPATATSYQLRLTSAPFATVKVAIITDGQTDVDLTGADPRLAPRADRDDPVDAGLHRQPDDRGHRRSATFTRANGSELGSFLDEGFAIGQRIRLSGSGNGSDGDYVDHRPDRARR